VALGYCRFTSGMGGDQCGLNSALAWHEVTGDAIGLHMRSRLYQLGELRWPDPRPPGQAQVGEVGLVFVACL
jgi:hypothetical protein